MDLRHNVSDHAVFAGGVHPLQHDQHGPAVLGILELLQLAEPLGVGSEHRLGIILVEVEATRIGGIAVGKPEMIRVVDTQALVWRPSWRKAPPHVAEERGHERRHHHLDVGASAHNADIRKLRLPLARQVGKNAPVQRGRRFARR